ncbi:BTB/POZ domain-containing protein [Ditylenchus destructor]|uniref:BTB/POZ domain-containing protein n=1 Tax=Ditylenchus destructor TaxID=166010 RepID=A0AAD4MVV9_9BILA|nr:BTB/POZ domain-containing protein [Ditylenchus destructor]
MSRASFVFNFNVAHLESASRGFPKSNVADVEGAKWYLAIEKTRAATRDCCRNLDIFLSCERGTVDGIYLVNSALILRGSLIDLLFTVGLFYKRTLKGSRLPPQELNGIIKLQGGHCMRVNKELLSSHSEYFHNIFHNAHFVESSQEAIDLTDFTYEQFRLLYKRIYQTRYLCTDGTVEFRIKSEGGVKEFKRLWNLADVQKYCQRQTGLQIPGASSERSITETLCMFDDVKEMRALLGSICCVSTEYVPGENQTVSFENVEDLLFVASYFQISKILDNCKEFLNCSYPAERRMKLLGKYNLISVVVS